MMVQVFTTVLLMSSVGSVLIFVLLVLKPITKRVFGSHWQYYIWLVVLIVMVLPVRIELPDETVQAPGETFDGQHAQDNDAYVMEQEVTGISNIQ